MSLFIDVYQITGEEKYLKSGHKDSTMRICGFPMSEGKDILEGWHANYPDS